MNEKGKNSTNSNYTIGIDIGTNSVGWAAIGTDYKLLNLCGGENKKGKDAWGVYLFNDAQTAAKRRMTRGLRRRYARRVERIRFLQELTQEMVLKKDDSFFIRLKDSYLRSNNAESPFQRSNHYNLFEGEFTDKDYYKKFKTIYHLRNYLMESEDKEDPRLIYLALHHIIKYRGNFLFEEKNLDLETSNLKEGLSDFFDMLIEEYDVDLLQDYALSIDDMNAVKSDEEMSETDIINKKIDNIYNILKDKSLKDNDKKEENNLSDNSDIKKIKLSRKEKVEKLTKLFKNEKEKDFLKAFFSAIVGIKANYRHLLRLQKSEEEEDKKDLMFSFDDKYDEIESVILSKAEGNEEILNSAKKIYYSNLFEKVMQNEKTISRAMIKKYEKHKLDLKKFKACFDKVNEKNEYNKMFKATTTHNKKEPLLNYVNYVGTTSTGHYTKKISEGKFYKEVKQVLETIHDSEEKEYCLKEIEAENFLPKINSVLNSAIPYQMQRKELETILEKQGKFYSELEKNRDKILAVFNFKRPYYVGVLKGERSWYEKLQKEKGEEIKERITPWNFSELVNYEEMEEAFIGSLTNNCAIFKEEECLPLASITYQKYICLNEINKIKIRNKNIDVKTKQLIFDKLCCEKKDVSKKDIVKLIKTEGNREIIENDIGGLAENKLLGRMSSYIDFKKILNNNFSPEKIKEYDETIRTLTIFSDEKTRKKRLKSQRDPKNLKNALYSEQEINALSKKNYKKWGSYSRKFLDGVFNNENKTVLDLMYEQNLHIQEIINEENGFKKDTFKMTEETQDDFDYKRDILPLYCSPSVKKSIWNALQIIEEIVKANNGQVPYKIFLETTRSEKEKKRTESRLSYLNKCYQSIKDKEYFNVGEDSNSCLKVNEECENYLNNRKENKEKISERLYLWLTQLGMCMYTGEKIPFKDIPLCQIDHIIPQAFIKDDSLENKVLVKSSENQRKKDTLGVREDVIIKMSQKWKKLYETHLIGTKKYKNLQLSSYDDTARMGFINRQLVETGQIIKEVRRLLAQRYPETEVRGIKASLNSVMRQKYRKMGNPGFYKIRKLNDLHHAKDAYLAAAIGQFTTVDCPVWAWEDSIKSVNYIINKCIMEGKNISYLLNKKYGLIVELMSINKFDGDGVITWDAEENMGNILGTMKKNTCLVVKKKLRVAEKNFYNQTIYGPYSKIKELRSLKIRNGKAMPTYYGGYSSVNTSHFVVLEIREKGKTQPEYKFKSIPTYCCWQNKENKKKENEKEMEYLLRLFNDSKYDVSSLKIIRRVYKYQKIMYFDKNSNKGHLSFITAENELNNAHEIHVDGKFEKMLYYAERSIVDPKNKVLSKKINKNIFLSKVANEKKEVEEQEKECDELIKMFVEDYCVLVEKYMPLFNKVAKLIREKVKDNIDNMSTEEKIDILNEMMALTDTMAHRAHIDGKERGRMIVTICPEEISWIDESRTGLFSCVKQGIKV